MADQREIIEELNRASRNLGSANAQFGASAAEAAGSAGSAIASLQELGSGAIQFSRAMTNGQEGMSKYGAAIGSAADGIGGLAQLAGGPLMFVFGGLIKIVGAVTGAVLESNDTVIKGYDKLADIGGAAAYTTSSLMKAADEAHFPVKTGAFTKFTDTMSKMGGDFLGLGATAGEGMKKFMEMATIDEPVRHQFNRLGISQEKLTQVQAQYVATQLRIGGLQNKDAKQLRKESTEYATNLVELAAVTGQSVDQIAKNREEDMKDVAYAIKMREVQSQENGAAMAERMNRGIELAASFGPSARKAVRDVMASGQLVTPDAIALNQQFAQAGLSLNESTEALRTGRIDQDEFNIRMQTAAKATFDKMGKAMMSGGTEVSSTFGITGDTFSGSAKQLREGTAAQTKLGVEAAKDRVDVAKSNQDALLDTNIALGEAFDKFIELISGAVSRGFQALMFAFKTLTKGILGFLTKFEPVFKIAGSDLPKSLPYMFDSLEDLVKQQKESATQLASIEQKKAKLKTSRGSIATAGIDVLDERVEQNLRKQQLGINLALQQLLGTTDVEKVLKEKEAQAEVERTKQQAKDRAVQQQAQASAAPSGAPAVSAATATEPAPKTISIGSETTPNKAYEMGGIAKHPMTALGPTPTGSTMAIPLPGGRSIATSMQMPADLANNSDGLLTQTDNIDRILSGYTANLTTAVKDTTSAASPTTRAGSTDFIGVLASKMDELLSKMKDNTNLQSELLALSKR